MQLIHSLQSDSPVAPLVVMVHGRAFDMSAMRVFDRSLPEHVSRLYLQAPFEDPEGGYCWWNMFSEQDPADGLKALMQDLQTYRDDLGIQPQKVVALGFSQGAAMLSGVIQQKPETFQGVALLAGMVLEQDTAGGGEGQPPSVLMIHGTQDERVPISKARAGAEFLTGKGYPVEFLENDVGHKVGASGMRRLKEWVSEQVG